MTVYRRKMHGGWCGHGKAENGTGIQAVVHDAVLRNTIC